MDGVKERHKVGFLSLSLLSPLSRIHFSMPLLVFRSFFSTQLHYLPNLAMHPGQPDILRILHCTLNNKKSQIFCYCFS